MARTRTISNRSDFDIDFSYHGADPFLYSPSIPKVPPTHDQFSGASPSSDLLARLDESDNAPEVGIHPGSYLFAKDWFEEQSYPSAAGTYSSPDGACSNFLSSAPLSMESGISDVDYLQPLSRQNSARNGSGGVYMATYMSSQSYQTREVSVQDPIPTLKQDHHYATSPDSHPDLIAIGSSFAPFHDCPVSSINNSVFLSPPTSYLMQRSVSNRSSASGRSLASNAESRPLDTLTKQLASGKVAKIRPRFPGRPLSSALSPSNIKHRARGTAQLQRCPYRRPRGPKVFCTQCNEQPEGFRGEHELRRHISAKHSAVVKKYVCRNPASVGLSSTVSVIQPLSDCKACTSGKEYGIDYNAAAHLRRTHFRPKPPRGRNKKPDAEKRGGKGGGSWPTMAELKPWIMEVSVAYDEDDASPAPTMTSPLLLDGDANDDGGDEGDDEGEDNDENGDPVWTLPQAADQVGSEYSLHGNYAASFKDTQMPKTMPFAAGHDAHLSEFHDPMSYVHDATQDLAISVENGLHIDQTFAYADFLHQPQVSPWPMNDE
ncbi:hypothetical protein E4U55_005638 [Claviceps digitariae]|nr:hypothetical protein E4U55_005638 [Claviceps digitariae]